MYSFPFPALLIGAWAGAVTTISLNYLPNLVAKWKLFDTRGIFFIHGIPGIWGGIASAITVSTLSSNYYGSKTDVIAGLLFNRDPIYQGGMQFWGLLIALGIGIAGGVIWGFLLRIWRVYYLPEDTFGDHIWWKMIPLN